MAKVIIRNLNDLIKIIESRVSLALKMTQDEIYKVFQEFLLSYYHEPVFHGSEIPFKYERTYKMFNSMIKTNVVQKGNSFSCTVEVDPDYLDYQYSGGATGQQVWEWANDMRHGGTVEGNLEVWNNAIEALGGEQGIINIMKKNLQKCGVPIV